MLSFRHPAERSRACWRNLRHRSLLYGVSGRRPFSYRQIRGRSSCERRHHARDAEGVPHASALEEGSKEMERVKTFKSTVEREQYINENPAGRGGGTVEDAAKRLSYDSQR